MSFLSKLLDTPVLLEQWFHAPKCIGAIAPSSQRLARVLADWAPLPAMGHCVLELGPGTGAVTEALFDRGIAPEQLLAIETTPALAALLRGRFPRARIIQGDARELFTLTHRALAVGEGIGSVVSSLPLRHFSAADTASIARQIHALLPPAGRWIQFTYHLRNGQPPERTAFRTIHSDVVWLNVPPARVLVYEKE